VREEREEREEREFASRLPQLLDIANIPKRFQRCAVNGFEATTPQMVATRESVVKYLQNLDENIAAGRSVVMAGPPGTGKTHLACAMITAIIKSGHTAIYTSVLDAARDVKSTYGNQPTRFASELEAYQHYTAPDVLVIDEVGVQYQTDAEAIIVWEIINRRYNDMKVTILISNETWDEMTAKLGERIMDRMRDSNGLYLPFVWESYRQH
jgi:DNA replication protein DnaC